MEEIYIGKRKNKIPDSLGQFALFVIVVAMVILFFFGVSYIGTGTIDRQEDSLTLALERDIIQCYCLEGMYPPSLDYIKEHYGLLYNEKYFFIDYRPIASNIYPDVTIIRIK